MTVDPIDAYVREMLRRWTTCAATGRADIDVPTFRRLARAVEKRHGQPAAQAVHQRAMSAAREILEGAEPPPPPQAGREGWAQVEADMICEQLVAEYRAGGIVMLHRDWRDIWNGELNTATEREIKRIEQRAPPQRRTAAPAPAPEPLMHKALPAEVKAVESRSAPEVEDPDNIPLRNYRGVYRTGRDYHRGDLATDHGASWVCVQPTQDRPGSSAAWKLVSKGIGTKKTEAAA